MDAIRINREDYNKVVLLHLKGDLHKPNALKVQTYIEDLMAEKKLYILLNLEDVTYVDSQAILILLKVNREVLASGGVIKLLRPRKVVKQFMSIGKVFELFEKFETKIDAIQSFEEQVKSGELQTRSPEQVASDNQRAMILRLIEILMEKGMIDMDEFNEEFVRSSQLVIQSLKQQFEDA